MPSVLTHALRSLKHTPVFSVAATFTLVLGTGSVAAMFAIVYGVLLAPLPYLNPERLVSVGIDARSPELRHLARRLWGRAFSRHAPSGTENPRVGGSIPSVAIAL